MSVLKEIKKNFVWYLLFTVGLYVFIVGGAILTHKMIGILLHG